MNTSIFKIDESKINYHNNGEYSNKFNKLIADSIISYGIEGIYSLHIMYIKKFDEFMIVIKSTLDRFDRYKQEMKVQQYLNSLFPFEFTTLVLEK